VRNNDEYSELISADAIATRLDGLAAEINSEFAGQHTIVICTLKGAWIFAADLVRRLDFPMDIEFLELKSYYMGNSTGDVTITKDIGVDIKGCNVLVLEDIVDTGTTLQFFRKYLEERQPAKLKVCVLLDNPARRKTPPTADFTGFVIPDEFVVGYGLDYNQLYRNLPFIAKMNKTD